MKCRVTSAAEAGSNLRHEPYGGIVGIVRTGEVVERMNEPLRVVGNYRWQQIRTESGTTGWVAVHWLTHDAPMVTLEQLPETELTRGINAEALATWCNDNRELLQAAHLLTTALLLLQHAERQDG